MATGLASPLGAESSAAGRIEDDSHLQLGLIQGDNRTSTDPAVLEAKKKLQRTCHKYAVALHHAQPDDTEQQTLEKTIRFTETFLSARTRRPRVRLPAPVAVQSLPEPCFPMWSPRLASPHVG